MDVFVDGGKSETRAAAEPFLAKEIFLRTDMDFKSSKAVCAYSVDGKSWTTLGGEFEMKYDWRTGTFQGTQFAIFCYNANPGDGFVDVDWFHFTDKKE
jgi:hypothetical protein